MQASEVEVALRDQVLGAMATCFRKSDPHMSELREAATAAILAVREFDERTNHAGGGR